MKKTFEQLQASIKDSFADKTIRRAASVIIALILALIIFQAGVTVGFRKAHFAKSWNDNYYKNFGPNRHGVTGPMPGQFPNAHGTVGKIISTSGSILIVEDRGTEKTVSITDTTKIRKQNTDGISSDLTPETYIVVVGDPNDQGQINAKFIRIMPAPPSQFAPETN